MAFLITLSVIDPVLLAAVAAGAAFTGLVVAVIVAFLSLKCSYWTRDWVPFAF